MAMKKDEILVLGVAGVAVYMIVKGQGLNLGGAAKPATRPITGVGKTPATNYYSPWFGITGNSGYSLFDGVMDSLGISAGNVGVGSNKGTGTGLGLKLDNTGLGMSYGGVESDAWGLFSGGSGSWGGGGFGGFR